MAFGCLLLHRLTVYLTMTLITSDLVELIREKSSVKGSELDRIVKGLKWYEIMSEL